MDLRSNQKENSREPDYTLTVVHAGHPRFLLVETFKNPTYAQVTRKTST
jgi:hypothetical protein